MGGVSAEDDQSAKAARKLALAVLDFAKLANQRVKRQSETASTRFMFEFLLSCGLVSSEDRGILAHGPTICKAALTDFHSAR